MYFSEKLNYNKIKYPFYLEGGEAYRKFYGHDKEVNDQYELKIKTKFISHSCIITSQETLDRLRALFYDKGIEQEVMEVANGENSVEKNYSH
ncbi:hypothetical protein [Oceanobacillus alkalisoli]|uniref:hypothetical protein n=1 Tax=Oceanobacillus alkalisoli TaxID=2925113 RepID=UPI001EE4B3D8|nr:hypothetical protein [Oceanobacillus alkalisoli]MCG5102004.1 hypothetical protein [Oceanobacillus alkalisoli]